MGIRKRRTREPLDEVVFPPRIYAYTKNNKYRYALVFPSFADLPDNAQVVVYHRVDARTRTLRRKVRPSIKLVW